VHENSTIEQTLRQGHRGRALANQDRNDRAVAGQDLVAELGEPMAQRAPVSTDRAAQRIALAHLL
jgi:hypothetical protein